MPEDRKAEGFRSNGWSNFYEREQYDWFDAIKVLWQVDGMTN